MIPDPPPLRQDKSADYLKEFWEQNMNSTTMSTPKPTNWDEWVKNNEYGDIIEESKVIEKKAQMLEQISKINNSDGINPKYDDLMIESINAKLAVLKQI